MIASRKGTKEGPVGVPPILDPRRACMRWSGAGRRVRVRVREVRAKVRGRVRVYKSGTLGVRRT